jgi:hypothetical protein
MTNFDPTKQYRCTIIRGKAVTDLDNLLPKYANIIEEICPCEQNDFPNLFNNKLKAIIGGKDKTLNNHRTEIAGKLFGMFFVDQNNIVYPSERTLRFIENQDQPEFFKDICVKFQFPNGMDKSNTIQDRTDNKISIRPFSFILELLSISESNGYNLNKNEIAFFVLSSLEVLQGKILPSLVLKKIIDYRNRSIKVKVEHKDKASSYSMQHINEQLNLLELSNLIRIKKDIIFLNPLEKNSITYIKSFWDKEPSFNIYQYDFNLLSERKRLSFDWQLHFSRIDKNGINIFNTSIEAIQYDIDSIQKQKTEDVELTASKIQIGDDGENFIYNYEKERVMKFDRRLSNKVILLGKTKGLGYDIQSIVADGTEESEFVHYIEVKSTKRVTVPEAGIDGWLDSVNLTRNEWVAAKQHHKVFLIYRVYFTPQKTIVYVIKNPYQKSEDGLLKCIPISYRLDFKNSSIDFKFEKA